MAYFDERLKELYKQKSQKKRLEAMIEDLQKQEELLAKKVVELETIKKKEQMDVDRLEGKSLKSLLATLVGNKEEKLSKERQEAYAAALKHDAAKRELEFVISDLGSYRDELKTLETCETEYAELFEQKKQALKTETSQKANEILLLEKKLSALESEIVELEEALDVGYKAFDLCDRIVDELTEAHSLAEWDTFMDSMLIDMQKHEHIGQAQNMIHSLQTQLRRFHTELADVNLEGNIKIEIDDFSRFADYFFDNIFTDWDVKSKIENALSEAEETRGEIKSTIHVLKDMRDNRAKDRIELEDELENLVVL